MFIFGIALFILSCAVCVGLQSSVPLYICAIGAFVSVFFRGYRGIFIGFVIPIGLYFVAVVVICGAMGVPRYSQ